MTDSCWKYLFGLLMVVLMVMLFCLIMLLLPFSLLAQELRIVESSAPGHLGMVSNAGVNDVPFDAMRYSLNIDVFTKPGVLQQRKGLQYYGDSNLYLYGAAPYYNPYYGNRLIVGIHDSTFVWFDSAGVARPSLVGHFFVSDTFGVEPTTATQGLTFPYKNAYHDWLPWRDMLFHSDGKTVPSIITTSQTFSRTDTVTFFWDGTPSVVVGWDTTDCNGACDSAVLNVLGSETDTAGFQPRAISLGLEAPGQLRVGVTDMVGPNNGAYQYAYAYWEKDSTHSKMSRYSAIVSTEFEVPYLTQFERYEELDTVKWKLILRRKLIGTGTEQWYIIDTLKVGQTDAYTTNVIVTPNNIYPKGDGAVLNYRYALTLAGDDGVGGVVKDSVSFYNTIYSGRYSIRHIVDTLMAMIDTMTTMSDSVSVARVGGFGASSCMIQSTPPCSAFVTTVDTGSIISKVLDSAQWSSAGSPIVYLDTIADSQALQRWSTTSLDTTIRTPGGVSLSAAAASGPAATTPHLSLDSFYNLAYSYYDPTTGLESPLGPATVVILSDSVGGNTVAFPSVSTGWPSIGRPQWIRWYQGAYDVTGGTDTSIWYERCHWCVADKGHTI